MIKLAFSRVMLKRLLLKKIATIWAMVCKSFEVIIQFNVDLNDTLNEANITPWKNTEGK